MTGFTGDPSVDDLVLKREGVTKNGGDAGIDRKRDKVLGVALRSVRQVSGRFLLRAL